MTVLLVVRIVIEGGPPSNLEERTWVSPDSAILVRRPEPIRTARDMLLGHMCLNRRDYVKQELGRLKAHYEERTADDRFYALASECIAEIYGSIRQGDFNSMSSLRGFMAGKQNIIHDLIQQQSGSVRLR